MPVHFFPSLGIMAYPFGSILRNPLLAPALPGHTKHLHFLLLLFHSVSIRCFATEYSKNMSKQPPFKNLQLLQRFIFYFNSSKVLSELSEVYSRY